MIQGLKNVFSVFKLFISGGFSHQTCTYSFYSFHHSLTGEFANLQ